MSAITYNKNNLAQASNKAFMLTNTSISSHVLAARICQRKGNSVSMMMGNKGNTGVKAGLALGAEPSAPFFK